MKKFLALLLAAMMILSLVPAMAAEAPLTISLYYSDNSTLPFRADWPALKAIQEKYNVVLNIEPIPIADYTTKVGLALSTGENAPDVILGTSTAGQNASLALNGAAVAISDYADWTPNFNARVAEFALEDDVEQLKLGDGKRYYLPQLYDKPFYDGGLILREDYLEAKGFAAPKTFDDLYEILKAYKADYPDSLPLTTIVAPRVLYRMTMPSWGVSLGLNAATGTSVLSWDYEKGEYFAGAISEQYKQYVTFFNKLYEEGLLDPEMTQDATLTSQKLATGKAMATYGYYDQIGGWTQGSEIEGFKLNMYPVLEGPGGAHHQPKNSTGGGIMFPIGTAKRADFEQVVRKIDEIFFSEEAAKIWCIGMEGTTYTMNGETIVYADEITSSADGIYKYMQNAYGCGCDGLQLVWYNAREMTKYDENYAAINAAVAAMPNAIQYIPATPSFDDLTAEDAALLQTTLADAWEVWNDAFLTGKKDIDAEWDAYVQDLKDKGIEQFCEIYNTYKK
ncbi:MAG: extracellular solute-binding protein [Clostridia bacterium]|nr:extracellular solute-binding protein [Clostridia bacterium]